MNIQVNEPEGIQTSFVVCFSSVVLNFVLTNQLLTYLLKIICNILIDNFTNLNDINENIIFTIDVLLFPKHLKHKYDCFSPTAKLNGSPRKEH